MQFIHDGLFHKVARITGPSHNLLGLEFTLEIPVRPPRIVLRPAAAASSLNADAVIGEVIAGIDEANQAFGTHLNVTAIQYLTDDTPPEATYRLLAFSLVERLAKNLPFVSVPRCASPWTATSDHDRKDT
jgi:hypothetical protein